MNAHDKEQLVSEIVDTLVKRKDTKVKVKTKSMKLKRKFSTRKEAKEYEQQLRAHYTALLLAELDRMLEEE